jgi:hypothetical protein
LLRNCKRCKNGLRKALTEVQEVYFDPVLHIETMLQRYLPGLDTSKLDDETLFRKYHYLLYILKSEGIKSIQLKGMGGD